MRSHSSNCQKNGRMPFEKKYAIVFMDAIHFHVREDNRTVKKAVYVAIGIRLSGQKEVLGMWIGGMKVQKYWLCTE